MSRRLDLGLSRLIPDEPEEVTIVDMPGDHTRTWYLPSEPRRPAPRRGEPYFELTATEDELIAYVEVGGFLYAFESAVSSEESEDAFRSLIDKVVDNDHFGQIRML